MQRTQKLFKGVCRKVQKEKESQKEKEREYMKLNIGGMKKKNGILNLNPMKKLMMV